MSGTCIPGGSSLRCHCQRGWSGPRCFVVVLNVVDVVVVVVDDVVDVVVVDVVVVDVVVDVVVF